MKRMNSEILDGGKMKKLSTPERIVVEIVSESIPNISPFIIQELSDELIIASTKKYLKNLIENPNIKNELINLQTMLEKRYDSDLNNQEIFSNCNKLQLEILVVIKLGSVSFLSGKAELSELVEIFMNRRCRNLACLDLLPAGDCGCKFCSRNKGFCNLCMCAMCFNFDSATNTSSWICCDLCLHWYHTSCGIQRNLFKPGPSSKGPSGTEEMNLHCIVCGHDSKVYGFAEEVFTICAKDWSLGTLLKELDCLRRLFKGSEDHKGKELYYIMDDTLLKLQAKMVSPSAACNYITRFFRLQVQPLELIMDTQQMIGASSSSSSSSAVSLKKYNVFLSFRGEDTRKNFTSHLYDALSRKKIDIFMDNEDLEKGDKISPTLIKAIEESYATIVIFSENYASSKWCLNELSKILECKKDQGLIVIPVFYNIDPSHVRNQTGSYEKAFAKHNRDLRNSKDKLQKWKAALTEAANLVGWDSRSYRTESEFIKGIVQDILQKLNLIYPIELKGLVGNEENYVGVESLLEIGTQEVRMIGIWGMGGIGKTTLAIALYAKLSSQFEGHCFLENVREQSEKKGIEFLLHKLLSTLLEEENLRADVHVPQVESHFVTSRLRRKKVLIVLDDLATSEQLENLIGDYDFLGPGSRVIVTTRDKHIFSHDDKIYEVKELNKHDSLQLFCLNAFREKHPVKGYEKLSESVIAYCKGNPLALKVLGARLRLKSKEAWASELKKLIKIPDVKIHNVLKSSYDDLDALEKDILLDIACFFKGKYRDHVTSLLEACGFFATAGIEVLLGKALITISNDRIEMHDLIQEMGREIVHQESIKDPGKRSRLWKPEEVADVLKNNKGTEDVECIRFDSKEVGDLHLSSDFFRTMANLRYLEIYINWNNWNKCGNVYFRDGLGWLSDKLRYLQWDAFPLESLPSSFCAEMIVELHMPHSKLKKLWGGVQNLANLKYIGLDFSTDLIEIPNLSRASNLERVSFSYCESLLEVHPSILSLPKLRELCLCGCKKIESLKSNTHSKSLCVLNLSDCSSLTEFSVTSEEMMWLSLRGTAIHELLSSIWHNSKLTDLFLHGCKNLSIVGKKLSNDPGVGLESLTHLDLSGCSQINTLNLGNILDGIKSLKYLELRECCNLEVLPDNIQNHSVLQFLILDDCRKLLLLTELPASLQYVTAVNCFYLQNIILCDEGEDFYGFRFLPGAQVPGTFEFRTTEASIMIPPVPKSDLFAFVFCIILSEGLHLLNSHTLCCFIYENGTQVHKHPIRQIYDGTLISDHVLLCCWYDYYRQESGGDHCNLSFEFKLSSVYEEIEWSTEGIKGCGVIPVHVLEYGMELDGGGASSSTREDIFDLEPRIQISYDELQLRVIGGEVDSSVNEKEEDQEQPSYSLKQVEEEEDLNKKSSCDCSIGLLLKHLVEESKRLFFLFLTSKSIQHPSIHSQRA